MPQNEEAAEAKLEAIPPKEAERQRRFKRSALSEGLAPAVKEQIVQETYDFLKRRFKTLAVEFDDISKTNFNPFLLLITAPVYNIFSPFEVAERLQLAKAFHGDDTAFGRLAEEKFLTILGAELPPMKKSGAIAEKARWSPIDLQIEVEGHLYLISVKAGPWTMNQSHANEMITHFPKLHETTKARIIVGVTYGRYKNLNNKPYLVARSLDEPEWYDYLVGKDLWEFISGVKDVHKEIFAAIRQAQKIFASEHADETFSEKLVGNRLKIAASLRKAFNVGGDEDFWGTIFNAAFEAEIEEISNPEAVPPISEPKSSGEH
ncbi:MAG: PmeII family type II restriction endonuclease [Bosea sp. (in: a-proteobacteria)]